MNLRHYQQTARHAIWQSIRETDPGTNPCAVLPTGSGKTPLLASLCEDAMGWGRRVMILSHVKELLQQSYDTLRDWSPGADVGIYSAGLKRRDTKNDIVIAGIQSVADRPHDFGQRNVFIVDEAHLIPVKGQGRYRKFLETQAKINPKARVIGLTATPYRTDSGQICGPDNILSHICHQTEIAPLIEEGFLCPITNQSTGTHADLTGVAIRGGEYVQGQMEQAFQDSALVQQAVSETLELTRDRKSILVFAAGVEHGWQVLREFDRQAGVAQAEFLCGDTPALERDRIIRSFKAGDLRVLINVNVLTTGFDARMIDAIAVLRATCSAGLFYQMCGRGFRVHEDKQDCLILDYGQNIERHGALDSPDFGRKKKKHGEEGEAPMKECPGCRAEVPLATMLCTCGFEFPPAEESDRHGDKADQKAALLQSHGKPGPAPPEWLDVVDIAVAVHRKKDWKPGDPQTFRIDYRTEEMSIGDRPYQEWICVEHPGGYARMKAEEWWRQYTHHDCPFPHSADEAVQWWQANGIAWTEKIKVFKPDKYWRITDRVIGPIPSPDQWEVPEETAPHDEFEEIPF